jgi:tetratricopeptide (TPR) repeat protein
MDQNVPLQTPAPETLERIRQLIQSEQLAEADRVCRQVFRTGPDDVEILLSLARFASQNGEDQRATLLCEQAVATGRAGPGTYTFLCNLYRHDGRLEEALEMGRRALKLPGVAKGAPFILALVHRDLHEFDEAAHYLLEALALDSDYADARLELGQLLLRIGEFEAGWIEYEWRFAVDNMRGVLPKLDAPQWNGMRLPKDRILLIGDQGYGDTIQFARYIPRVRERVQEVLVACSRELLPLISGIPGIKECFVDWEHVPSSFGAYSTLSGLPRIFETKRNSIPTGVPYLKVDPAKVKRWSNRLLAAVDNRSLRVGVVWAGRPSHPDDRRRSLKWTQLRPLTRLKGVALISLQKEIPALDRPAFPGGSSVLDLSAELGDFGDTAAVIENLDLVVTVDSSVAHLAGALAKPVWVMLPWLPDWRWMLDRDDSPWYPTLRLLRQHRLGDWSEVIARVTRGVEMASVAHHHLQRQGSARGARRAKKGRSESTLVLR